MMNNYCVYMHTNLINNKKYIGITKQIPTQRWGHNGRNYKSTPHFYNAILKYGWDNFKHEILYSGLTQEDACKIEIELIKKYRTQEREYGYNILSGGTVPLMPQEIKDKLSQALKGNKNGLGKPCSEEKKKKISEAQKGIKFSEERKKKISDAKKGKTHAPPSKETRKKISDAHEKCPVFCEELNKTFPSIQECARELGLWATLICKCCKGKLKTTGGYHFKYI